MAAAKSSLSDERFAFAADVEEEAPDVGKLLSESESDINNAGEATRSSIRSCSSVFSPMRRARFLRQTVNRGREKHTCEISNALQRLAWALRPV